jgi:hypothetical protein
MDKQTRYIWILTFYAISLVMFSERSCSDLHWNLHWNLRCELIDELGLSLTEQDDILTFQWEPAYLVLSKEFYSGNG